MISHYLIPLHVCLFSNHDFSEASVFKKASIYFSIKKKLYKSLLVSRSFIQDTLNALYQKYNSPHSLKIGGSTF